MSELVITSANFVLQPVANLRNGPAILRWAYNRQFLASDGAQVFAGTQSIGFGVEVTCAIADGLITVDEDSTLWTTDDAQDPSPASLSISAWLLTPRGVLIAQLTIAGKTQFVVPSSLAPSTTWSLFSNYNQAVHLVNAPDFWYTAAEIDRLVRQWMDHNPASDLQLGTVLLTVPADIPTSPVVWGANDPLVRDAVKLQGINIGDTAPLDSQALIFNEANNQWEPGNQGAGTGNVLSNEVSSVDGQVTLASGTGGKTIEFYEDDGLVRTTGGVPAPATVGTADVDDDAVTYAKLQNVSAAARILGRGSAAGAGDVQELTVGTGVSISGTVISATGTGGDVTAASNLTDEAVVVGDGGVKGVQTTPVTINPGTGLITGAIVGDPTDEQDIANKTFVLQSVAAAVQQTPNITALVSGGGVIWESDYNFRVSQATYLIQGDLFTSTEQTITLDAADPALDRIDVIALDNTGTVVKITGTAAAQPSQPDVDPGTQLFLTFVFVGAATTAPPNVTDENIYLDNAEWTATTSGVGWNPNSTNNPHSGTKDIEGTNVANNAYVQLQAPSPLTLDSFALLSVFIRSKAAWPKQRSLLFQWYSTGVALGVPVTINTGFFGFDSSQTSSYQLVVIPVAQFAVPAGTSLNQLRITDKGGAIGMYVDDIVLQAFGGDIGTPPSPGITQEQADARYLQRANNLNDVVTPNTALNALLPTQVGQSGKILGTNGSNTSWVATTGSTVPTAAQGDTLYASAANTLSTLAKDTNATRYLSNTGASNNPAWAQVSLTQGVSGDLPLSNLAQFAANTVAANPTNGTADLSSVALSTSQLVGRGSSGDIAPISLGSNMSMSGTTLSASGGTIVSSALGLIIATSQTNYIN